MINDEVEVGHAGRNTWILMRKYRLHPIVGLLPLGYKVDTGNSFQGP
jgi:hypothetical protein